MFSRGNSLPKLMLFSEKYQISNEVTIFSQMGGQGCPTPIHTQLPPLLIPNQTQASTMLIFALFDWCSQMGDRRTDKWMDIQSLLMSC